LLGIHLEYADAAFRRRIRDDRHPGQVRADHVGGLFRVREVDGMRRALDDCGCDVRELAREMAKPWRWMIVRAPSGGAVALVRYSRGSPSKMVQASASVFGSEPITSPVLARLGDRRALLGRHRPRRD
jgi:hypothetical protein